MFLRRCQRRKNGKRHTYWALVESYRTAKGSRQRTVAYLGELKPCEQDGWAKLGSHLKAGERARLPQRSLFDPPTTANAPPDEEPVRVRLRDVRFERLRDEAAAGERLGRLKQQNWRASSAFDVTLRKLASPRGKQQLEIVWRANSRFADWSQLADGCYVLRSNLTDVDAATLWRRYIQLTEAEWAFRITKDELSIRPIWHQREERVRAHILVGFLAYAMWKTLAGWMRGAGLGDAPRTLLHELAKIRSGDVVLPAETAAGERKLIRLRHVTEPDAEQALLLHRLGLTLPRRLRRLEEQLSM